MNSCALESSDIAVAHVESQSVEYSREEVVKQTPNQSPILAIFVEYSGEKNMVDVSTVGWHRVSNEVRRNKSSALAALLLLTS